MFTLAVVAFAMASCGSSKTVANSEPAQQQSTTTDDVIAEKRRQLELQKLEHEMEMERLKMEGELIKAQGENKRLVSQLAAQEKMEAGTEVLLTFCIDEAMDQPGEYMAGLGISQGQLDQKDALISANQVALSDITSRFLGVMKNGIEMYNKETNTVQRNKAKESQLEGLAMSVGEKAINKHADVVCRKVISEKAGTYGCYVAVHVPVGDVVKEVVDELEILQVDFDKSRFRDRMNEELNANIEKTRQEQEKHKQSMQGQAL